MYGVDWGGTGGFYHSRHILAGSMPLDLNIISAHGEFSWYNVSYFVYIFKICIWMMVMNMRGEKNS